MNGPTDKYLAELQEELNTRPGLSFVGHLGIMVLPCGGVEFPTVDGDWRDDLILLELVLSSLDSNRVWDTGFYHVYLTEGGKTIEVEGCGCEDTNGEDLKTAWKRYSKGRQ